MKDYRINAQYYSVNPPFSVWKSLIDAAKGEQLAYDQEVNGIIKSY